MSTTLHKPMRRQDRVLTLEQARRVIEESVYGVLSTVDEDGVPYGTPIHFSMRGDKLFFHTTSSGDSRRAMNIQANDRVSVCFVRHARIVQEELSTDYASAIVSGRVSLARGEDKSWAVRTLLERFAPDNAPERNKTELKNHMHETEWWVVDIDSITGKCRGEF